MSAKPKTAEITQFLLLYVWLDLESYGKRDSQLSDFGRLNSTSILYHDFKSTNLAAFANCESGPLRRGLKTAWDYGRSGLVVGRYKRGGARCGRLLIWKYGSTEGNYVTASVCLRVLVMPIGDLYPTDSRVPLDPTF